MKAEKAMVLLIVITLTLMAFAEGIHYVAGMFI